MKFVDSNFSEEKRSMVFAFCAAHG